MNQEEIKLGYRARDILFKKYFNELKIKVALNWCELIALLIITFFICFKLYGKIGVNSKTTILVISVATSFAVTLVFSYIRKYKLSINRFDKENLYKRVSKELIEKTKEKVAS